MKVLIIVIVVLVLLMVVGMGQGSRHQGASTNTATTGWPAKIGSLIVRKQPLAEQDIQAAIPPACLTQFRQGTFILPQGAKCELIIKDSRTVTRQATLQLQQGASANVHLELYGKDRLTSNIKLEPGAGKDKKDVQFFREGGALTITCVLAPPGGQCRIAVR